VASFVERCGCQINNLVLYPTELQPRKWLGLIGFEPMTTRSLEARGERAIGHLPSVFPTRVGDDDGHRAEKTRRPSARRAGVRTSRCMGFEPMVRSERIELSHSCVWDRCHHQMTGSAIENQAHDSRDPEAGFEPTPQRFKAADPAVGTLRNETSTRRSLWTESNCRGRAYEARLPVRGSQRRGA
jgi:hypothetical protein